MHLIMHEVQILLTITTLSLSDCIVPWMYRCPESILYIQVYDFSQHFSPIESRVGVLFHEIPV